MAHRTLHAFGACAKPETLHGDATDADADSNGELRLLTRTSIIQILQAKNPPHLDESRPLALAQTGGIQGDSFGLPLVSSTVSESARDWLQTLRGTSASARDVIKIPGYGQPNKRPWRARTNGDVISSADYGEELRRLSACVRTTHCGPSLAHCGSRWSAARPVITAFRCTAQLMHRGLCVAGGKKDYMR